MGRFFLLVKASFRRNLRERMALRLSFVLELASIAARLGIFLLIDRYQQQLLGDARLNEAAAELGTSYFGYVAVGLAVAELAQSGLGGVLGQFHHEKSLRTLPLVLAAPVTLWQWAAAAGIATLVRGCFYSLLILGLAGSFLGLAIPSFSLGAALLVVLVSFPVLWALSLLSLAGALLLRRGDPVGFVVGILFEICGGVYAPVSVLPNWMQKLSSCVPLRPALEAMQAVIYRGAGVFELLPHLQHLFILSCFYLPLAYICLRFADLRARRLGFYHLS